MNSSQEIISSKKLSSPSGTLNASILGAEHRKTSAVHGDHVFIDVAQRPVGCGVFFCFVCLEEEEACGKPVKLYASAFHLCVTEVINVKDIYSCAEIKLAPSAVSHR